MLCHRVRLWSAFVLACFLALAAALPVAAQPDAPPPGWPHAPGRRPPVLGARQDPATGMWRLPAHLAGADGQAAAPDSAAAYSGPDQFGYVATQVPMQWIDATAGTAIPFAAGLPFGQSTYLDLPFPFKFYENSYTSVFVAAAGYLAFSPWDGWGVPWWIGGTEQPNNAIYAYPAYYSLAAEGTAARVYTLSGGTAPNRYFVAEWHEVVDSSWSEPITNTFQIVLEEDGDMRVQLKETSASSGGVCSVTGIEDASGMDFLPLGDACEPLETGIAWQISRPNEGAHIFLYDAGLSGTAHAGRENFHSFLLRNTGNAPDRFNVAATSGVPVRFAGPNGATLTDSDGDGAADTGLLGVGEAAIIQAAMQYPAFGNTGDANAATLLVSSARDPALERVLSMSATIPPAFAQARQYSDAFDVIVSDPAGQSNAHLKSENPAAELAYQTIATRPEAGYVAAWVEWDGSGYALQAALLGLDGRMSGSPIELQAAAGQDVGAFVPSLAVAPDGHIGVAWVRGEYKVQGEEVVYRYNIRFAVLAADGTLIAAPADVTDNIAFAPSYSGSLKNYGQPQIVTTGDNRFALAWDVYTFEFTSEYVDAKYNVEMALRSSTGALVSDPFLVSDSAANGKDISSGAEITALAGDRVAVAYGAVTDVVRVGFTVVSSAGSELLSFKQLGGAADALGIAVDEIGGGALLFVWPEWDAVRYTVLDGANFSTRKAATALPHSEDSGYPVYVTHDGMGSGVISWGNFWGDRIVAGAVDPDGGVVVPPTTLVGLALQDLLDGTAYPVYAGTNAPHALGPTTPDKADLVLTVQDAAGAPGGPPAALAAHVRNRGARAAEYVELTAQVDAPLEFAGASPKPASVVSGAGTTTVRWALPDLDNLGGGTAVLLTNVPSATVGSSYPVTFTLTTPAPVLDPAHGVGAAQVMVAEPYYLPVVAR